MEINDVVLFLLDLFTLDEAVVDSRLEIFMKKEEFTVKELICILKLVQYKKIINSKLETACTNDKIYDFLAILLKTIDEKNVNVTCDIVTAVLLLNISSITEKCENLLQQIFSEITSDEPIINEPEKHHSASLLRLKICDSILYTVIKSEVGIKLPIIKTSIKNILNHSNERVITYFLTHIIPKLHCTVDDVDILKQLWKNIIRLLNVGSALKIIICLIQYYLPFDSHTRSSKSSSCILLEKDFWNIIVEGLKLNEISFRKLSLYLAKRAIDCVILLNEDVLVKTDSFNIFMWINEDKSTLEEAWDNFFILLESLEEKQSNIVIPSLQLFDTLQHFGNHWLEAAFKIGLKHDSLQVRRKCIDYRLKIKLEKKSEMQQLLIALNDINLFECPQETDSLKGKLCDALKNKNIFVIFFKVVSSVRWSQVPFFHITSVLAELNTQGNLANIDTQCKVNIINDLIKIPCNNAIIGTAVLINIAWFLVKSYKDLHWAAYIRICCSFKFELFSVNSQTNNPFKVLACALNLEETERLGLFECISESHDNIDFGLLYLNSHEEDIQMFLDMVDKKITNIQKAISTTPCPNLVNSFNDAVFLIHLLSKTDAKATLATHDVKEFIMKEYKLIVIYFFKLLANETTLSMEDTALLFKNEFHMEYLTRDIPASLRKLFQDSLLVLRNENESLDKKILSISIINHLIVDIIDKNYKLKKQFMDNFNIDKIIDIIKHIGVTDNVETTAKLKIKLFQETCELIYKLLKRKSVYDINQITSFIVDVIDCGGYDCLKFIPKICIEILPKLAVCETFDFDKLLFGLWNEFSNPKSTEQFNSYMRDFIRVIIDDNVLQHRKVCMAALIYFNIIISVSIFKKEPIYLLLSELYSKPKLPFSVTVFVAVLTFNPVLRKDQRITENVEILIFHDPIYEFDHESVILCRDFYIQHMALLPIIYTDQTNLNDTTSLLQDNVKEIIKYKRKYHANSESHRSLLKVFQHLLILSLKSPIQDENFLTCCCTTLGSMSHQASVRICLEWYITIYLYIKDFKINEALDYLETNNVPLQSQLTIIYWLTKHRILATTSSKKDISLALDMLLSHTMGPQFNIRLHAKYYIYKLYELPKSKITRFATSFNIIQKTLNESCHDKNYIKLQEDYFANDFDIVGSLTPYFIYEILPTYDIKNFIIKDHAFITSAIDSIDKGLREAEENCLKNEWLRLKVENNTFFNFEFKHNKEIKETEDLAIGNIKKKYIPWTKMNVMGFIDVGVKEENKSDLILVASLVDKLPNLGDMARTSEALGVKTYVIDSIHHLHDQQFEALSVSADKPINIREVQPGRPLLDYLLRKKTEGYFLVAAEQTSSSYKLEQFKFPKKTLLLLGHEKDGIPCDLLPIMDYCVEIPQQGLIKSLNVHVTAAIFIWEYSRQHLHKQD